MTEPQRIVFYEPLAYQLLAADADIQTYHEFRSAFDNLATACRARGQAFERIYIDVPAMLLWLRGNGNMPLACAVILLCAGLSVGRPSHEQASHHDR
jgi:hypothetical protein